MVDVAPEGTLAPGWLRFTTLNALVASARKVSFDFPGSWKSRETARSMTRYLGPSRELRGVLPSVATPMATLFWTNVAVLNH